MKIKCMFSWGSKNKFLGKQKNYWEKQPFLSASELFSRARDFFLVSIFFLRQDYFFSEDFLYSGTTETNS